MNHLFGVIVLSFGLVACQPKGTYTYHHAEGKDHPINQVIVVIDYLNLRDDIGKYWDFDSYYHQSTLDQLFNQIKSILADAGYPEISAYMLSSGLLIKHEFAVEHYWQNEAKSELLYPPYLLAQENIPAEQINQHQEFLTIMVKYLAQRRHHENDPLSLRGMQMGYRFENMSLADDTGLLYVHINHSAPGAIKQLSALLLSGVIASQADYAHIGIDFKHQKHSSVFWIHKGSGKILWKNYSNQWLTDQPLKLLLSSFPIKNTHKN